MREEVVKRSSSVLARRARRRRSRVVGSFPRASSSPHHHQRSFRHNTVHIYSLNRNKLKPETIVKNNSLSLISRSLFLRVVVSLARTQTLLQSSEDTTGGRREKKARVWIKWHKLGFDPKRENCDDSWFFFSPSCFLQFFLSPVCVILTSRDDVVSV